MIKAIDLFAGAGGLSYGFYLTGEYELVAAAEINENARATYKQNIAKHAEKFEFINNVIGYDFGALNQRKGGEIDVVIGGPPCQGFSNANRQKNHLISMNNSLVKEYFRAIKQIRPKAFVMENVSMLESDTHRFYDSYKDNAEIEALIAHGFKIPKRMDSLVLADRVFADIDLEQLPQENLVSYDIPSQLKHLLSVLRKNLGNGRRLPNFLIKNASLIKRMISEYLAENQATTDNGTIIMTNKLSTILTSLEEENWDTIKTDLDYVVDLQKLIECIREITSNELIGEYEYSVEHGLRFITQSYSVIDYVNAILGNEYIQKGNVFNADDSQYEKGDKITFYNYKIFLNSDEKHGSADSFDINLVKSPEDYRRSWNTPGNGRTITLNIGHVAYTNLDDYADIQHDYLREQMLKQFVLLYLSEGRYDMFGDVGKDFVKLEPQEAAEQVLQKIESVYYQSLKS